MGCIKQFLYGFCKIIFIRWIFSFVYFVGSLIHKFKILTEYLCTLIILNITRNPQIQVPMNISIVIKPRYFVPTKLNDFTLYKTGF